MDPLSITVGIAGLTSLGIQIHQIATKHVQSAKNAPKEAQALADKLSALISVLEQLDHFIEKHAKSGHFTESSVLVDTTKRCEASLQQLQNTLSKFVSATIRDSKKWRRYLKWPLLGEKHQQTVTMLNGYLEVFHLSLSIDGL